MTLPTFVTLLPTVVTKCQNRRLSTYVTKLTTFVTESNEKRP